MTVGDDLPDGLEHVRTTDWFDQDSMPDGLRRAHRIAEGVWGRLVVAEGSLTLRFEDTEEADELTGGTSAAIPPGRPHRVETSGPVRFAVEFHRAN